MASQESSSKTSTQAPSGPAGTSEAGDTDSRKLHGWRRWAFPVLTVLLVPLLLLGGLELVLHVSGYGVSSAFWQAAEVPLENGGEAWTPNPRFGWRFFPPAIARSPMVSKPARNPEPGSVRLLLVGGSAALGTPDSAFGFGRLLEVMLHETFPDRDIEVVNGAMTAVSSHVVLPIAEESLERLKPDALLVYLGNNEVVGPYGPGTVFEGFSDSLSAIRWSVWLSSTRTGQLIRNLAGSGGGDALIEWQGLEMFEDRELRANDPRLEAVYQHLEANLRRLAARARSAGVPMLLSTVAVNLIDNPPFASVHREDLSEEDLATWQEAYDRGIRLLNEAKGPDDVPAAIEAFEEADAIDDGYADLHFYLAHGHRLIEDMAEAERQWKLARDLDALRFRADSRIGEVIRRVASEEAGVELIDGEAAVTGDDGLPGNDVFWEHVHLNPEGNYRLAEAFFDRLVTMPPLSSQATPSQGDTAQDAAGPDASPTDTEPPDATAAAAATAADTAADVSPEAHPEPPPRQRVAELLGLSPWHRHRMVGTILGMTSRPPFTHQLGHREVLRQRRLLAAELGLAASSSLEESENLVRKALEGRPDDLSLRAGYAELLHEAGKMEDSLAQWDDLLSRVPGVESWRTRRAYALADLAVREAREQARSGGSAPSAAQAAVQGDAQGDTPEATQEAQQEPQEQEAGTAGATGETESAAGAPARAREPVRSPRMMEALDEMQAILDDNRFSPEAWLNLGAVAAEGGHLQRAEKVYREALELFPSYRPVLWNLGKLLADQGDLDTVAALYRERLEQAPDDVSSAELHGRLGEVLELQGNAEEAASEYRKALELSPDLSPIRNNLGFLLERQGKRTEAVTTYQQAIQSDPSYPLPYFNLGDLLLEAGQADGAAASYAAGLKLAPFNLQARYNLAMALAAGGRQALAVREFRRLLEVAPEHPGALNNLAWILANSDSPEVRNPEEAVELAERAVARIPNNPTLVETLARAYAAAGRRADARDAARRALDLAQAGGNQQQIVELTERLRDLR